MIRSPKEVRWSRQSCDYLGFQKVTRAVHVLPLKVNFLKKRNLTHGLGHLGVEKAKLPAWELPVTLWKPEVSWFVTTTDLIVLKPNSLPFKVLQRSS